MDERQQKPLKYKFLNKVETPYRVYPKVKINEKEDIYIAIRLSKAGYGTVEEILNMSWNLVESIIEYEKFQNEYEEQYIELNKRED